MKAHNTIDELFSEAIKLRNCGKLDLAKDKLFNITLIYPQDDLLFGVYVILGGILSDQGLFGQALKRFKKSLELKPDYELASLGIYLLYIELEEYDRAIRALDEFLSEYPADLYKTTLEELITDLRNGYARDHESVIIRQARNHGVSIID
ncbi:MAG: tetratricopeptide repeat protein [Roseivirga sp.]|nr:tetratricopeptide repeat protein [Roseivirga sp.]